MASRGGARPTPDYHLGITVEDGLLLLHVQGDDCPGVRQHVAEVERAARRCGLRLAVIEAKDQG